MKRLLGEGGSGVDEALNKWKKEAGVTDEDWRKAAEVAGGNERERERERERDVVVGARKGSIASTTVGG